MRLTLPAARAATAVTCGSLSVAAPATAGPPTYTDAIHGTEITVGAIDAVAIHR